MKKLFLIAILIVISTSIFYSQSDSIRYELKPVIVTATRVSESWLEVPLALSVVEAKDLQQVRGYGLDEALSNIPGVLAQSRYGNQDVRLTIRGFGARGAGERSNAGTSRGIRVLLDGFPETEPDGRTSFDLIDMAFAERIEVIRSNASSLWGNASGGIVNIISNTTFDNPFTRLQTTFGSFGYRKEAINVGTPLGSGKFFMYVSNTNFDGWRHHSASTRALINTGIVSPIGENTTVGVYATATSNLFRIPGPLTKPQFDSDPKQAQADTNNYKPSYVERDERRFNRLGRLGVNLSHNFDENNSITAMLFATQKFLQRSERNTFRDFTRYHIGGSFTYRNIFNISEDFKNILFVGTDEAYQDGAILFYNLKDGQRGNILRTNKREGANNFGAFVQNELMISDELSIIAGARYDNITYYSEDFMKSHLNASKSFKQITPKAGVTYRLTPNHSIYANLGGGVEVPAANEIDPDTTFGLHKITSINPLLEPIRSNTYEVGSKYIQIFKEDFLIRNLTYDAAIYWIEIRNDIIPYSGGRFYFTAGKTRRIGSELATELVSNFGVSLKTSLTYSSNKYIEYIIDSVHYGKPGKLRDLKDKDIAGVPEFFYKASLRYNPTFFEKVFIESNIQGVGKYFADDANEVSVSAYNILNASFGFDDLSIIDERFIIRAFLGVNNVFNLKYVASAFINPDYDRGKIYPIYLEPGMPRNYIGSISLSWNF